MDLYFVLQNLNLPYFYYKEQKIYFNYDEDVFFFGIIKVIKLYMIVSQISL